MDGNYSKVQDIVWKHANVIIWLDYHSHVVYPRLLRRVLRRSIYKEVLWNGNTETLWTHFFTKVKRKEKKRREEGEKEDRESEAQPFISFLFSYFLIYFSFSTFSSFLFSPLYDYLYIIRTHYSCGCG